MDKLYHLAVSSVAKYCGLLIYNQPYWPVYNLALMQESLSLSGENLLKWFYFSGGLSRVYEYKDCLSAYDSFWKHWGSGSGHEKYGTQ